jgi:hypothetical protein
MSSVWASPDTWLSALRRYLAVIAAGNLVWEFAHMPLYTLWQSGTGGEIVFAALHCTAGDLLIATASLVLALVIVGDAEWPHRGFVRVAALTVAAGVGYTVFSEWLNVEVRRAWTYSASMPTLPWLGTGLSPLAQWVAVPVFGAWAARRNHSGTHHTIGRRA